LNLFLFFIAFTTIILKTKMPTCFICKEKINEKFYRTETCLHEKRICWHEKSEYNDKTCEDQAKSIFNERFNNGHCVICTKRLYWFLYEKIFVGIASSIVIYGVSNIIGNSVFPKSSYVMRTAGGFGILAGTGFVAFGTFAGFLLYSMWGMDVVKDKDKESDDE
jgi:hypothetical protein